MNAKMKLQLETSLRSSFNKLFSEKDVYELRKIDWLSLNPDFHIDKGRQKKAA